MWNKTCRLGKNTIKRNEANEPVKYIKFSESEIFCNRKSIRSTEFYQAQNTTLRPEITLEVRTTDYDDYAESEEKVFVSYEGKEYTVIRTYIPASDTIELVLQRGIIDAST